MEYTPPIVAASKLEKYTNFKDTIDESGLNIGGYIRVSTAKDSQKTSIDNQKKYIIEWAQINGYNIVDFYVDIKTGAYSYMRNEMIRLKNDITLGKIRGIVSKEISRTSRDIMDIIDLKRNLADRGAFFISIKEGYDSRTDDDEFLLIIHAGLAQKERKITSSRVKITQLIKAKEGKTNVPSPALGYMLSEDKQHLVINPETVDTYNIIVDKFLQGWGRLKICKYLNQNGIRTKSGGTWSTNSIRAILINPVYLGVTIYNATIRTRDSNGRPKRMVRPREDWIIKENTHPALITQEKFEKIQQIIQTRKENDSKEWNCSKKYLLSGLLYCASCGNKIYGIKIPKESSKKANKFNKVGKTNNVNKVDFPYDISSNTNVSIANIQEKTDEQYYYYYFDKKANGKCNSKLSYYKLEIVEKQVMDKIKNLFESDNLLEDLILNKLLVIDRKLDAGNKDSEILDKIDALSVAIKKQQQAYESDAITLDEYKCRMSELREKKINFEKRLKTIENKQYSNKDKYLNNKYKILAKVKELINNINNLDYDIKEEIVRKVIKRIYINDDYSMTYEFNFTD